MLSKQSLLVVALSACPILVVAAPVLTMHVFDEEVQSNPTAVISESTQEPTLQMHVFDNSAQLKNNAVVMPHKDRPKQDIKKPVLGYKKAESYIKTGYRRDEMDWTIAGLNGTPNILSELKWRDIDIATINIGTTLYTNDNWLVNADMVYGRIFSGKNQDSDYLGDNRTFEFSRSNNNSDKGDVLDLSVALGYYLKLPISNHGRYPQLAIIPKVGLSYYSQNFTMTDGVQTVALDSNNLGPFPGLNSTYDSTWFGPWAGLELELDASPGFKITSNVELHYADYDSTANWNLRGDLANPESYTNEAKGFGVVSSLDGEVQLNTQLSLILSLNYQYWRADRDGEKTTYGSDGTVLTGQPFNGVRWHSFGTNIGLQYEF